MKVELTLEDFPSDKKNCGNCTRKAGVCPRRKKSNQNGYVMNSVTGEVGGIIYCCPNYTGHFEKKPAEPAKQLDLFNGEGYVEPKKPTKFCRTCKHRQRMTADWSNSVWQYCSVRRSNRTQNGLLKIKAKNPACDLYEKLEKGGGNEA